MSHPSFVPPHRPEQSQPAEPTVDLLHAADAAAQSADEEVPFVARRAVLLEATSEMPLLSTGPQPHGVAQVPAQPTPMDAADANITDSDEATDVITEPRVEAAVEAMSEDPEDPDEPQAAADEDADEPQAVTDEDTDDPQAVADAANEDGSDDDSEPSAVADDTHVGDSETIELDAAAVEAAADEAEDSAEPEALADAADEGETDDGEPEASAATEDAEDSTDAADLSAGLEDADDAGDDTEETETELAAETSADDEPGAMADEVTEAEVDVRSGIIPEATEPETYTSEASDETGEDTADEATALAGELSDESEDHVEEELDDVFDDDIAADEPIVQLGPGEVEQYPIALWPVDKADGFHDLWRDIQLRFVDEPEGALQDARDLVTEAISTLAQLLHSEQSALDSLVDDNPDTETMRITMLMYKDFMVRVLSL